MTMAQNHISIIPRMPKIDWAEVDSLGRWYDNNPIYSHIMNAYSFVFPQGERYFVEVVREVNQAKGELLSDDLKEDVHGFIKQETLHASAHFHYNKKLEAMGFKNLTTKYIDGRIAFSKKYLSMMTRLAIVVGIEHYTAILGGYLLENYEKFDKSDKKIANIWGWHACEETEHKAVCFDVYKAVGGTWLRLMLSFIWVTIQFNGTFLVNFYGLLYRSGQLKPQNIVKTMYYITKFYWQSGGVGWYVMRHILKYISPNFHPWDHNNRQLMNEWLQRHAGNLSLLRNS